MQLLSRDELIVAMIGTRVTIHFLTNQVGIGYSWQQNIGRNHQLVVVGWNMAIEDSQIALYREISQLEKAL